MSGLTHVCTYAPQNGHHPLCDTEAARWAYAKALSVAWQIVDRAVTPLGHYGGASNSPWNQGYEQAKNEATNALFAALQEARALLGDGGVDPAWPPPTKGHDDPWSDCATCGSPNAKCWAKINADGQSCCTRCDHSDTAMAGAPS